MQSDKKPKSSVNQSAYPAHRTWMAVLASLAVTTTASQAQKLFYESFDNIPLGPSLEEEIPGSAVWSKAGPTGWIGDDSQMPGLGTSLDGVTEWAGWSFADKNWWAATAGNQRRTEWRNAQGNVMIADPDEWDDSDHATGLFNSFITTPSITIKGAEAGSLVMTLDSSWRPEAFDDGLPSFPVDENNRPINHQNGVIWLKAPNGDETEILNFDSDNASVNFHKDGIQPEPNGQDSVNEAVVIPLNNAAGDITFSLKFGMLTAANDWWWAVDNIAIGVPPFVSGITNNGVNFGARITEALDKTLNDAAGVTAELDGTAVSPSSLSVERPDDKGRVWVLYTQDTVFAPRSKHVVKLKYTTGEGKQVEDSIGFTAPGYVTTVSSPTAVDITISEPGTVAEPAWLVVDETKGVQLELDGAPVTATSITRVDNKIVANYAPATSFASGSSHVVKVKFTTSTGQVLEETVSFKAPVYETLPVALATDLGTGSENGLRWRTHQLDSDRGNAIALAEQQLAGALGESVHNPDGQGDDGYFLIDYVNFDEGPGSAGNFRSGGPNELDVPDLAIPGIPGTTGKKDWIAGEALTYLELPTAGLYHFVVNSDDGFQLSVGPANNLTQVVLGKFDGGRGTDDTDIYFNAPKAGVYPFRLLWFEGDGGAAVEWFSINPDGTRALIGGGQAGSIVAYRSRTEPPSNGVESITRGTDGKVTITFKGTLKSSTSVTGPFEAVAGAASPLVITPSGSTRFYRAE